MEYNTSNYSTEELLYFDKYNYNPAKYIATSDKKVYDTEAKSYISSIANVDKENKQTESGNNTSKSTIDDSFASANIAYTSFKSFNKFKEFININFKNKFKTDLEIQHQYMIFLNSPKKINKELSQISINMFGKVITLKMKLNTKYEKKDFENSIIDFENIENVNDYFEKEMLLNKDKYQDDIITSSEWGFETDNLTADQLLFLSSHELIYIQSPELNQNNGPQMLVFKNKKTNKLQITFRGTTTGNWLKDWRQDIHMWSSIGTPQYFKQMMNYLDDIVFEKDENGELILDNNKKIIKKEWKNVEFNGHSLGGSLAAFASQYIKSETRLPKKNEQINKNVVQTFNAANITRLLKFNNLDTDIANIDNYRLVSKNKGYEILSFLSKQEGDDNTFKNYNLFSFRENFDMWDSHGTEEIYYSIIIYRQLIQYSEVTNIAEANRKIQELGFTNTLSGLLYIIENSSELNFDKIRELPQETIDKINNRKVSLEDAMAVMSNQNIKSTNSYYHKIKNNTINACTKIILGGVTSTAIKATSIASSAINLTYQNVTSRLTKNKKTKGFTKV